MKVKLKVSRATNQGVQEIGQEIDVDKAEAERMFKKGHAEPVNEKQQPQQGHSRN